MSTHVHVRLRQGIAVGGEGELVEQWACRCGEEWTRTHRVADGPAED
ncbi:hypothetical protein [Kitasatospora sp. NPDC051914]